MAVVHAPRARINCSARRTVTTQNSSVSIAPSPAIAGTALAAPSPQGASSAISLSGITRRFGHKWALRGIELDVGTGDLVVIQGHNGGGKSTLLRIIATAVQPTSGQGRLLGLDLRRDAARVRERSALLGTANGVYEDLSAHENLLFAARMLGVRQPTTAVADALKRVNLAADADERVRAFSSGMQRRLALARIMLQNAQVLLLDEPFNTLDADGAAIVNGLIASTRERGGAVVVVLHDVARLAASPTATYTMTQGRLA